MSVFDPTHRTWVETPAGSGPALFSSHPQAVDGNHHGHGHKVDESTNIFGYPFVEDGLLHDNYTESARMDDFDVSIFLEDSFLNIDGCPILSSQTDSCANSQLPQTASFPSYPLYNEESNHANTWTFNSFQPPEIEDSFVQQMNGSRSSSTSSYIDFPDLVLDMSDSYDLNEPAITSREDPLPGRHLARDLNRNLESVKSWIASRPGSEFSEHSPYPLVDVQFSSEVTHPAPPHAKPVTVLPTEASTQPYLNMVPDQPTESQQIVTESIPPSPKCSGTRKRKRKDKPDTECAAKRVRFLERNRLAAKKCREKKKGSTSGLQSQLRVLEKERFDILLVLDELRAEVASLTELLDQHRDCGHVNLPENQVELESEPTEEVEAENTEKADQAELQA